MATQRQEPPKITRYITVQDAVERLGIVERTVRRWIEKKKLHAIRDASGFIRLDLDEVEQIAEEQRMVVPSLLERIEQLESEKEVQEQKYNDLQRQIEEIIHLLAGGYAPAVESGPRGRLTDALFAHLPLHRWADTMSEPLERRGLPAETTRLVTFAQHHQVKLSELKKLYLLHEVDLTVYQRGAEAIRNKQEWWITPAQHHQVADYCQRHGIAYTPCTLCTLKESQEKQTDEALDA